MFHLVGAYMFSGGTRYRVMVFPASPILDPTFHDHFPDDLGIPTDSWSYLSEQGVGLNQGRFNRKSADNFFSRFEKTVRGLLVYTAIPYLDQFQHVADLLPVFKQPGFMGLALHHIGRVEEARPLLEQERERLLAMGTTDGIVLANIQHINKLLSAQ